MYVNSLLATLNARAGAVRDILGARRDNPWCSLSNIQFKSRDEGLSGGRVRNFHHGGLRKALTEWCDVAYNGD